MKTLSTLYCAALCAILPAAHGQEAQPPATSGPAMAAPNVPDGFTIKDGRVHFIRGGQMMPLDREVILRVSPNGTVTAFDGSTYSIPQGQVLVLAAGVAAMPATAQPASPTANASPAGAVPAATSAGGRSSTSDGTGRQPLNLFDFSGGFVGANGAVVPGASGAANSSVQQTPAATGSTPVPNNSTGGTARDDAQATGAGAGNASGKPTGTGSTNSGGAKGGTGVGSGGGAGGGRAGNSGGGGNASSSNR